MSTRDTRLAGEERATIWFRILLVLAATTVLGIVAITLVIITIGVLSHMTPPI